MVSISACHAAEPGSIPGRGDSLAFARFGSFLCFAISLFSQRLVFGMSRHFRRFSELPFYYLVCLYRSRDSHAFSLIVGFLVTHGRRAGRKGGKGGGQRLVPLPDGRKGNF